MFKQYAVEPKGLVGSGERAFAAFWHLIGHTKGRFIVEYPRYPGDTWLKQLGRAIREAELSDREKKKLEAKLCRNGIPSKVEINGVELKIVKGKTRAWDPKKDWMANVKNIQKSTPFDGVITHQFEDESEVFLNLKDVDEDHPLMVSGRTFRLARSGSWIGSQLGVLFEDAITLSLVDSYFDPRESRWLRFLRGFLDSDWIRNRYNNGLNKIRFHCDAKVSRAKGYNLKTVIHSSRKEMLPKGIEVEFCLWNKVRKSQDSFNKEEMHPRAIFSDQVGLNVDWGLDESQGSETICGVLDAKTHQDFILKFETWDEKFRPVDVIQVRG